MSHINIHLVLRYRRESIEIKNMKTDIRRSIDSLSESEATKNTSQNLPNISQNQETLDESEATKNTSQNLPNISQNQDTLDEIEKLKKIHKKRERSSDDEDTQVTPVTKKPKPTDEQKDEQPESASSSGVPSLESLPDAVDGFNNSPTNSPINSPIEISPSCAAEINKVPAAPEKKPANASENHLAHTSASENHLANNSEKTEDLHKDKHSDTNDSDQDMVIDELKSDD